MSRDDDVESIELRLLLEAIQARYGYDLREYAWPSLQRRALAALAKSGLSSFSELQHRVLRDPAWFARMLTDLTVQVTDLFRDPAFYRVVRERVVPLLRTYPLLKVWHAGCATGEEVYAAAILLAEEGLYERSQIYGTDLNSEALDHARQRLYSVERARRYDDNYVAAGGTSQLSAYYTEAYDHVAFKEALVKNVLFFQHDLVADHVFGEMQIIFCRNVLIYFSEELRDRVVEKFARSLCPGGFLCLGGSETLPLRKRGAFEEFSREHRIYRYTQPAEVARD